VRQTMLSTTFFFSSRRRHTRFSRDWSSDVCSSDLPDNVFQWNSSINVSANRNTLTALPNGLDELVVGNRKLKVGNPIDEFWVYENEGIYNDQADIPVQDGRRLAFEGVYLNAEIGRASCRERA